MNALASVSVSPASARPFYHPDDNEPQDCVCVLTIGPIFCYVVPSFQVLQVEIRQIRVKGFTKEREEKVYDFVIRNDTSLNRPYPCWMVIKDAAFVKVSYP